MTSQATIGLIEREWHAFENELAQAAPQAFDRPVFTGEGVGWRMRDLLAHLVFWQDLAARAAERIATERIRPEPDQRLRDFVGETRGVDELNAAAVDAARARPVEQVVLDLRRAHARLMDALRACPDELVRTGDGPEDIVRILSVPAILHLRTHGPHLDSALQKEGATST